MRSGERQVTGGAAAWLNSILARMLALAITVVLLITAGGLVIVLLNMPRTTSAITSYEIARQLRNQPIARPREDLRLTRQRALPPADGGRASLLVADAVAAHLRVPRTTVRVRLEPGEPGWQEALEAQYRLYAADGHFNPVIVGPFSVAVRQGDGQWLTLMRDVPGGWTPSVGFWLAIWLSVATILSWLFARRLSRPIRDFASAARRVGHGEEFRPIPLRGPTEIQRVAQSLNDMQARLARYVAERTSVVGAIAHDLRASLSRLNFHLASLPDTVRRNAEAEIREMEQMIMVTLDFVEHETRPQSRDPVELALLVEGVVDNFADMGRDVRLREAACATVSGDQLMLKRLFANLIDNAIKYGGKATVDVQREAAFAVVDVEDAGAGMKPGDIERAFEPFYRAEPSRSRRTGGVGLGLSIVKSVAIAHGGSVELANMDGGLRARVRLPLLSESLA